MNSRRIVAAAWLLSGLLYACSSMPLRRETPADTSTPAVPPFPGERSETPQAASGATATLLARAASAESEGDTERASSLLERAIRVAPADPLPWHHLAALRLRQSRWSQAEQFAARSNRLAGHNPMLQSLNWRIIAACQRALGDPAAAREAERQADALLDRKQ